MQAIAAHILPKTTDCDRNGRVLVWDNNMQYWSAAYLERATELLLNDPLVTHWQRMPPPPPVTDGFIKRTANEVEPWTESNRPEFLCDVLIIK